MIEEVVIEEVLGQQVALLCMTPIIQYTQQLLLVMLTLPESFECINQLFLAERWHRKCIVIRYITSLNTIAVEAHPFVLQLLRPLVGNVTLHSSNGSIEEYDKLQ